MKNYKLTIEYDGTHYNGWQVQANSNHTIQGAIEEAANKIFKKKIRMTGSGRTDSGVHAMGQVANVKLSTRLNPAEIKNALNANLPKDISVLDVKNVTNKFHAQFSAKSKVYRYTVLNRPAKSALDRNICLHYPYKLNLSAMRQEAKDLLGRHDFKSFQATDAKRREKDTIRTIKRLIITKKGDYILIDIEANGFLYKMVRNIVGVLLKVGSGKLEKGSVKKILAQKDRKKAAETAKACGLKLLEVRY